MAIKIVALSYFPCLLGPGTSKPHLVPIKASTHPKVNEPHTSLNQLIISKYA
jgi:hypothetical protein